MVSESIYVLIINNAFIFAGLLVRYMFYSKCKRLHFACCDIDRDVEHEASIQEINNTSNRNISNV